MSVSNALRALRSACCDAGSTAERGRAAPARKRDGGGDAGASAAGAAAPTTSCSDRSAGCELVPFWDCPPGR